MTNAARSKATGRRRPYSDEPCGTVRDGACGRRSDRPHRVDRSHSLASLRCFARWLDRCLWRIRACLRRYEPIQHPARRRSRLAHFDGGLLRPSRMYCAFRGSWAVISRHGGQRFHVIMGSVQPDRRRLWSQGFRLASRDRLPAILRMLSPVIARRWALWMRRFERTRGDRREPLADDCQGSGPSRYVGTPPCVLDVLSCLDYGRDQRGTRPMECERTCKARAP